MQVHEHLKLYQLPANNFRAALDTSTYSFTCMRCGHREKSAENRLIQVVELSYFYLDLFTMT